VERAEAEVIYDAGRGVVVAVLLRMDEQIRRLEERVARQDERIAKLERELNRSSRNSSAPPSARTRSKDPSGRKRGAQDGHEGHGRLLLPAWAVDEVIEYRLARCRCGSCVRGRRAPGGWAGAPPGRELPLINVKVIEHRRLRLCCPDCSRRTRAKLPEEVARSCFGSRLEAAVAAFSVRNRVSRDDAVGLCEELFGARISSGTVDAILGRAAAALAEPHEDLLGCLRSAEALNMGRDRLEDGRAAAHVVGTVRSAPRLLRRAG
jgi:transposase